MNAIVIGMPLSGKSTVFKEFKALYPNIPAHDTDSLIAKISGLPIPQIFKSHGTEYFRNLERDVISKFVGSDILLFCGGGAITIPDSNKIIRKFCKVIYLHAGIDSLLSRMNEKEIKKRPLLYKYKRPSLGLRNTMRKRHRLYEDAATDIIFTDNKSISEIIKELREILDV